MMRGERRSGRDSFFSLSSHSPLSPTKRETMTPELSQSVGRGDMTVAPLSFSLWHCEEIYFILDYPQCFFHTFVGGMLSFIFFSEGSSSTLISVI
jgi:hypothetical protein